MAEASCSVDGCDRVEYGKGLCNMHYQRWRKHGDVNHARPKRVGVEPCAVDGCGKLVKARGWCAAHWSRWKRHGSPTARLPGQIVDGKRICPICEIDKPLEEWSSGLCKPCGAARTAAWRERNPYVPKAWDPRTCDACGQPFLGNAKQKRYCSPACRLAYKNRANWKHMNNRRQKLRGAWVESFDRLEIFERDGWVCALCDLPVDKEARFPDPASASLDHVVPISLGGQHSRANAQCSHLGCNVRKGARILEEAVVA